MSTDERGPGAGDAGDDPRGSTGEDGLADAPVVEPDVRWRERPADDRAVAMF